MGSSVSRNCKAVGGEDMTGMSLKVYAILLYGRDEPTQPRVLKRHRSLMTNKH